MNLQTRLIALVPDWRRGENKDAIVIFGIAVLAYIVGTVDDCALALFRFGIDHADWEADEILFAILVVGVAMTVYGLRRYRDLAREIKARIRAEQEASSLVRHDPLTGLPNRRLFEEKLEECLAGAAAHQIAVLMLDLDGFKAVNDTYGQAVGDKALSEFADRVGNVLPADAVFARMGGDKFAIITPKIESLDEPTNLARRIAAAVAEPFVIENIDAEFGVGIGIAMAPGDGLNPDELVRRANRALCRAKATGRSTVQFFEQVMDADVERRIQLERELRSAIAGDILEPYYQPLVSLGDNCIIGFEALARWKSNTLGHIPPDVFIPMAEEIGLINALGTQLFRRACLDAKMWPETFTLAVNVSPVQLRDPTLGLRILSILGQTGLSPRRLEVEITESALMENLGVAQAVIDELRQAGVRIALDDFGTGYATLSQLLAFRLDKIKIDRSFVSRLGENDDSKVIIRAIIGIAKGFGLTTTAEGIEDAGQRAYLKANGCTEGQGYLFSKAVPAAEVQTLLNRQRLITAVA